MCAEPGWSRAVGEVRRMGVPSPEAEGRVDGAVAETGRRAERWHAPLAGLGRGRGQPVCTEPDYSRAVDETKRMGVPSPEAEGRVDG